MSRYALAALMMSTSLISCTQTAPAETNALPMSAATQAELAVEVPKLRAALAGHCTPDEIDLWVGQFTLFAVAMGYQSLDLSAAKEQRVSDELDSRPGTDEIRATMSPACNAAVEELNFA